MAADIFTKGFTEVNKWVHACQLIGHVDPEVLWGKTWKTLPCAAAPIAHADHRISVQESIFEHFWRYTAHLPGAKDTAGKLKVFYEDSPTTDVLPTVVGDAPRARFRHATSVIDLQSGQLLFEYSWR